jgi:hypothetical protein
MEEQRRDTVKTGPHWVISVVALQLLVCAWGAYFAGRYMISQLDTSRFGKCEEVTEALARASYIANRSLPYYRAAVALEALALAASIWVLSSRFRLLDLGVVVASALSMVWHGLGWIICSSFAT